MERSGVSVVGEACTGREAVHLARKLQPDVAVIDISMPDMNGIDATRRITLEAPTVRVLGLSMNADRRYVLAMLDAGAKGYLLKNAASKELLEGLSVVMAGQTYLSPSVTGDVVAHALDRRSAREAVGDRQLSLREREVLQLLAEGKSSKEIASALSIALPTVETHRRQVMAKLSLRTVAELTKYAIREGLTSS